MPCAAKRAVAENWPIVSYIHYSITETAHEISVLLSVLKEPFYTSRFLFLFRKNFFLIKDSTFR